MENFENTEVVEKEAKKEYVIVTDSTTDMAKEYYAENNIPFIGMHYTVDDDEYIQYSDNSLDIKTFYDKVRNGSMPKTSQVGYDDLYKIFEEIAQQGKDIFYLSFSGALSGSYQTSMLVAKDIMEKYPDCRVKVVDSVSACGGEGFLLHHLVIRRNQGADLDELTEYAEVLKYNTIHIFTVDDLNHLHRGGRLSKVSAVFGTMLGIKPILYFNDKGQLLPYSKVRGRKQSLVAMAKQMKAKYIPDENEEIFIHDADAREDAEYLGKLIMDMMPEVKKIRYGDIGAVIGAHAGPATVALFFIGKDREPVEIK
ncbi:MAG: DegV family protein [Ruminiclostridium sp.]|nr:DegV family protein [Ruminiclostridium sp.]